MNTITPDRVVAAFKKIGLRPIQTDWAEWHKSDSDRMDETIVGCCGLTALLLAETDHTRDFPVRDLGEFLTITEAAAVAAELLHVDPHYAKGFVYGWDSNTCVLPHGDAHSFPGYDDGLNAYKAVMPTTED
jgi:hypothetical protein